MAYTTIDDPSAYFKVQLYTGNGTAIASGGNVITFDDTDTDMQPDIVWTKKRSGADFNAINDAVRGHSKIIFPDTTGVEDTSANCLTSFNSDGFTVGTNSGFNGSSATYVAWCWKANGSGSSNGNGSISSTVSANTTAGISIVTFTGTGSNATVGHGLGAVPKCMWVKGRGNATAWNIYHASLGANKHLNFDSTDAEQSYTNRFNDTDPTSTVFTIGTDAETNPSGGTMVAYCFAEKTGFSKFGSYTGNGNANGSFVYTGFKPAFVIIKNTGASQNWTMNNNKSLGYNPDNNILFPNTTGAENTGDNIDLLSNGFKIRWDDAVNNDGSATYIYMAFAEAPLVGSNNVPATAR